MTFKNLLPSQILQFLTIVCLPLYIIRFFLPLGTYLLPTTLLEILILLSVIVTMWEFFQDGEPFFKLKNNFNILITLFLLNGLISALLSYDLRGGIGIFRAYFLEPILFFGACFYTAQKKGPNYLIVALFSGGLWLSSLALIQKLTGSYSLAPHEISQGRVSAVFNSANSLALYLGPLAFLSLALIFQFKNSFKYFYLVLSLIFTLIIVWTKSRGGLVGESVAALIFIYGLLSLKFEKLKKSWLVVPVAILIFSFFFFFQFFSFYGTSFDKNQNASDTLQIRYVLWLGTINLLKDHFIFGTGLNGFKALYSQNYKISYQQEDFQYPHNIFLNFWAETGLFGLTIFLLIIVRSFRILLLNLKKNDFYFGLGLISALSYLLIHGLVDVPYFKNDLSMEFWLIICLIELWSLDLVKMKNKSLDARFG